VNESIGPTRPADRTPECITKPFAGFRTLPWPPPVLVRAVSPLYARLTNRKNRAAFDTGSALVTSDFIWRSFNGVNSRANFTFSSNCWTESHPIMTVLTGSERA